MLIWGRANPEAMQDGYQGVYLNRQDMHDMVQQIETSKRRGEKIPVLIEHTGDGIGHVVSAWVHNDTLQCCLELDKRTLESAIGQQMVRSGAVQELSLGYLLDIKQSKASAGCSGKSNSNSSSLFDSCSKSLREISIVKKGARNNCKILGIATTSGQMRK